MHCPLDNGAFLQFLTVKLYPPAGELPIGEYGLYTTTALNLSASLQYPQRISHAPIFFVDGVVNFCSMQGPAHSTWPLHPFSFTATMHFGMQILPAPVVALSRMEMPALCEWGWCG